MNCEYVLDAICILLQKMPRTIATKSTYHRKSFFVENILSKIHCLDASCPAEYHFCPQALSGSPPPLGFCFKKSYLWPGHRVAHTTKSVSFHRVKTFFVANYSLNRNNWARHLLLEFAERIFNRILFDFVSVAIHLMKI